MSKNVIITGATSGIGKATAFRLAKLKYNLVIIGRRAERLTKLKNQIFEKYGVKIYSSAFDIQDRIAVQEAMNKLPSDFEHIDILINNAGLAAGLDNFQDGSMDDWDQMIDTNIKGLLYISKIIAKKMTDRKSGHIVNVSSIAGKQSYAKAGVYCATKHAVEAITKNMRIDMLSQGIKVSSVSPGAVETEFSVVRLKDEQKAKDVYNGYTPLVAEDIAETIEFIVTRPAHVNINDILIMPTAQADAFHLERK